MVRPTCALPETGRSEAVWKRSFEQLAMGAGACEIHRSAFADGIIYCVDQHKVAAAVVFAMVLPSPPLRDGRAIPALTVHHLQ